MNLKALAHLNCFQSIEITKFWILAVAKIHNSEQQVKWYAILMVNFELLCTTMIPPPWCDGSLSSAFACLRRHKNMVHLYLRAFATTRPWFICCRSCVLPLNTIHLHLGFSAPPAPTTTWFILYSYVPSLLLQDHDSSVAFICCSYVYIVCHHLQLRSSAAATSIWSYVPVRLKLRPSAVLATFPSVWSYVVHLQ